MVLGGLFPSLLMEKKTAKANLVNPAVFSVALGFWGGDGWVKRDPRRLTGLDKSERLNT